MSRKLQTCTFTMFCTVQLAIVKYDYFLSLFIRVMHHFHIVNFMNFILFLLKFVKFEVHNYVRHALRCFQTNSADRLNDLSKISATFLHVSCFVSRLSRRAAWWDEPGEIAQPINQPTSSCSVKCGRLRQLSYLLGAPYILTNLCKSITKSLQCSAVTTTETISKLNYSEPIHMPALERIKHNIPSHDAGKPLFLQTDKLTIINDLYYCYLLCSSTVSDRQRKLPLMRYSLYGRPFVRSSVKCLVGEFASPSWKVVGRPYVPLAVRSSPHWTPDVKGQKSY